MATGSNDADGGQLGEYIRMQRQMADLSLRGMAELTNVSNAYLSQVERGLHQPSLRVLQAIAEALDIPADALLAQAGVVPPPDPSAAARTSTEEAIRSDPGRPRRSAKRCCGSTGASWTAARLLLDIPRRMRTIPSIIPATEGSTMTVESAHFTEFFQEGQDVVRNSVDAWTRNTALLTDQLPTFNKQLDAGAAIDRYFGLGEKLLEAQRDFAKRLFGAATSTGVGAHDDRESAPAPAPKVAHATPKV